MHNSEMILPDPAGNTHASWTWINSLLIAFYQEHNTTMEIIISSIAILAIAVAIFIILKVLIISLKYWEHLGL
jgi:hypothetical protein